MIIHAGGKTIATDIKGNTQAVGVTGTEQDEIKVNDHEQENLLIKILKELKKLNLHMMTLTDENISNNDVEV